MLPVFVPSRREVKLDLDAKSELVVYTNYESITPGYDAVFRVIHDNRIDNVGIDVTLFMNVAQLSLRESRLETSYAIIPIRDVKPTSMTKGAISFAEDITPGKYLLTMGKHSPKLVTVTESTRDVEYDEHLCEAVAQSFMDESLLLQEIKYPSSQIAQLELTKEENIFTVPSALIEKLRITNGQELQTFVLRITCKTHARLRITYDIVPANRT